MHYYSLSINNKKNFIGKFIHGSCAYGIGDLKELLIRPELIAHKFSFNVEPAAYFCLYEAVRRRAFDYVNQQLFRGKMYSHLPQVQMSKKKNFKNLVFFNYKI